MTKQEEFLWLVQTALLANGINLAGQPEYASTYRHNFSASGVLGLAGDALEASKRIPQEMTVHDAAADFCGYMLDNLRQSTEAAEGKPMQCPTWFLNLA